MKSKVYAVNSSTFAFTSFLLIKYGTRCTTIYVQIGANVVYIYVCLKNRMEFLSCVKKVSYSIESNINIKENENKDLRETENCTVDQNKLENKKENNIKNVQSRIVEFVTNSASSTYHISTHSSSVVYKFQM